MFEFLFAQSSAVARYRSAPLLEERIRYLAHCNQTGVRLETLRKIASHQLSPVCTLDFRDSDDDADLGKRIRVWSRS